MKNLLGSIRRGFRALGREAKRDDGVIALVIAIALIAAAAALIAATVRQNKEAEVRRMSGNAKSVKLLENSVIAYYLTGSSGTAARRLPCPDTDLPPNGSGEDDETSNVCNANTGVVPWLDLRLSQDDVIDSYGNYFTYAVTGNATSRGVCESIANSYNSSQSEYTGTVASVSDTQVQPSNASYYYAFISHGENGLGAISRNGTARAAPSSSNEIQNCPSSNSNCSDPNALIIVSGPQSSSQSTYFDDTVYIGHRSQLSDLCETQTPAGKANAEVNESFNSTGTGSLPTSLSNSGGTTGVQNSAVPGNTSARVLRFTGNNSAITTATTGYNTAERARYISFTWAPTTLAGNNQAGISIGLRATASDRGSGNDEDIFNAASGTDDGLTIRYYEDTNDNADGSTTNTIYICDDTTNACNNATRLATSGSDTFTIAVNQTYTVEAYDDGAQIWARITQVGAASNTAVVSYTTTALTQTRQDHRDSNSILIINHDASTSEIDNLFIGRGSMAVTFDGTDDIVETAGDSHDTSTGNLTLEAWVRPDTLPSSSNRATFISKWTHNAASNSGQAYRFYMTGNSGVALDVAGDDSAGGVNIVTQTHSFGYKPTAGVWTYLAVSYNASSQTATLYVNGEASGTSTASTFDSNGVNPNGTSAFSVGAERDNTSAIVNEYDGDITDVRVWNTVRTAANIFSTYNRRIPIASGTASGLVVNWPLDRDASAAFGGTSASFTAASTAGAAGTLSGNTAYIGIIQRFFPAFSTTASFCSTGSAGVGTVVTPYQCEFRNASQSNAITIPNNLGSVYVKTWGGGGGGYEFSTYDSTGGGGGFSAGRLQTIGGNSVANLTVQVDAGGGGTASTDDNNGSGGGGASGIWYDSVTDAAGMIGGGGGGASFGDDNLGQGINCDGVDDCGPGGGGGGPQNIAGLTSVTTTRAADGGDDTCGGRGGDNSTFGADPPDSAPGNNCDDAAGGTDPTSTSGAGGSGAAGGASGAGAGGAGISAASPQIGAGGGGGGVRVSAMTSGGGEAGGFDAASGLQVDGMGRDTNGSGFGGGGGSGFADSAVVGPGGAAGSSPAAGGTSDLNYAPSYCNSSGTPCTNTPGRGGESGSTAGKPGTVIIKW